MDLCLAKKKHIWKGVHQLGGGLKGLLPYPIVATNVPTNEYMLLLQREKN